MMKTVKLLTFSALVTILATLVSFEANAEAVLRKITVVEITPTTQALGFETYDGKFIPSDTIEMIGQIRGNAWKVMNQQEVSLKGGGTLNTSDIGSIYAKFKGKKFQMPSHMKAYNPYTRAPRDEE